MQSCKRKGWYGHVERPFYSNLREGRVIYSTDTAEVRAQKIEETKLMNKRYTRMRDV
jgi:hypothetical protein